MIWRLIPLNIDWSGPYTTVWKGYFTDMLKYHYITLIRENVFARSPLLEYLDSRR